MNLHVYGGRAGAELGARSGFVTVVVDALRASATTASLLHYGAKRIIVVETVEQAFQEAARQHDSVLAGERGCLKVEGFDLGNSPLQQAPRNLRATVVFTSSNMSRCCVAAAAAPAALLGTTVTATTCARLALHEARFHQTDLMLVPAGAAADEHLLVLEDYIACGAIMARLLRLGGETVCVSNDAARAALDLYYAAEARNLEATFLETANGAYLCRQGFEVDVRFAARLDVFATVPRVSETLVLADGSTAAVLTAGQVHRPAAAAHDAVPTGPPEP